MPRTCSTSLTRNFRVTDAVERVVERGCLVSGPETDRLEGEFADWLGVEEGRVVAVSSGTDALTALLRERKVGPGDEVIVPAATFTATALAVIAAGATPVFVDVDATWTISPQMVEMLLDEGGVRPKAIIGVDLHGVPADWTRLEEVVGPDVLLFEDACPAYGARYRGLPAGRLGRDGAAFSLNESKQLFGGEGGLVVAPNIGTALRIRELRHFGHDPEYGGFRGGSLLRASLVGSNWKITEMAAAIARVGLTTLDERVRKARYAGETIRAAAAAVEGLRPHPIPRTAEPSWFKLRISAPDLPAAHRVADYLEKQGAGITRDDVAILTEHPAFFDCRYGPTPTADGLACTFCIGSRANPVFDLSSAEADRWAEMVRCIPSELVSP
jgi:dTDP-4-amino-4,6-dideoxygalactose transaminase